MSRRSLVTGGDGFIGSHLARALLERGDTVTVVDLPGRDPARSGLELQGIAGEVERVELDLAVPGAAAEFFVGRAAFDSVFHLAAQTLVGPAWHDPPATFAANVAGTWHLLEACRGNRPERIVVASSDKAYGPSRELPYRETMPLVPAAPYEASKAAAEMVVRAYASSFGLPLAVTRFANVYGGGDLNFSRLVPELMLALATGRPAEIRSDGSPERDYLYIDDAVAAYLAVESLTAPVSGETEFPAYNAGSGGPLSVRALIERLEAVLGRAIEVRYAGQGTPEGEIDRQWVDRAKLERAAGWRPLVSLEEGLRRTADWYRAYAEASGLAESSGLPA